MKNYFNFNLTGKKLLPIWVLFLVFFLTPYIAISLNMKSIQEGGRPYIVLLAVFMVFFLIVIAMALTFFIAKLAIENVSFKDKVIEFKGSFGRYIGVILLGYFLSIITLTLYMPWFIRDIHRFFVDNSSLDTNSFKFNGKGGKLFLILLLSLFIPVFIISFFMADYLKGNPIENSSVAIIHQLVMMIIMIPYMYLVYKWMVDISYKSFKIT